jgi:aspartate kinase
MIVCKFGGTSIQDAQAIERVARIVQARLPERPVVVASAMGRTTDALLSAAEAAAAGDRDSALAQINSIQNSHLREAQGLGLAISEDEVFTTMSAWFREMCLLIQGLSALGELTPRSKDAMASYGERLSTLILAAAFERRGIPAQFMDTRRLMITDDHFTRAAPIFDLTNAAICREVLPAAKKGKVPVLQGFIGATRTGITSTIGRGGSDYTASIVGAALEARDIQIWTDVDGIMTADPRIVPGARRIKAISFDEASELAYFGARVLHPFTILPAVKRNIPVHVLNSFRPELSGTMITEKAPACRTPIKSIACKKGITVINIASTRMLLAYGFLRAIFEIFDRFRLPVDVVSTSEVSVSLTVDETSALPEVIAELAKIGEVTVENGKSVVCCVGDNLRSIPGVPKLVFGALENTSVHMISQGASAINITFVIDTERMPEVVRDLHAALFRDPDPTNFE